MTDTPGYCPVADCRKIGHTPDSCVDCLRADRDVWRAEADSLAKMVETPAVQHRDLARAFIAKMKDRGVTKLDVVAVEYHLALLIRDLLAPRSGRAEQPDHEIPP